MKDSSSFSDSGEFDQARLNSAETVEFDLHRDPPSPEVTKIGTELAAKSRYRLLSPLAQGGMGIVYRGIDLRLRREVAIKLLRWEWQPTRALTRRFFHEALIISSLQHPGVIPIYTMGKMQDGRPFYVMKLLRGEPLSYRMESLPIDQRLGLLHQFTKACQTMAYAHSVGVVHLDLKPGNIMLGDFGRVRVIDWGLAKRLVAKRKSDMQLNANKSDSNFDWLPNNKDHSGTARGTPAYMPPEQANGKPADARSDVFALGAILCELVTGQPVYHGEDSEDLIRQAMAGATSAAMFQLRQSRAEKWLINLIKSCLQPDPKARPADAGEVLKTVSRLLEHPLRLLERDMVRFFELSPDLFCIADLDGYFRRVNANFTRVLGYSEQELLTQPFLNFVVDEDKEKTIEALSCLSCGGDVAGFRNRYRTADGEILTLEWNAQSRMREGLVFAVARNLTNGSNQ